MVNPVLRPTETVKVKLYGHIVPVEEENSTTASSLTEQNSALLAVVAHQAYNVNEEQGRYEDRIVLATTGNSPMLDTQYIHL